MLSRCGLELVGNCSDSLVTQIKEAITEYFQQDDESIPTKISSYLSEKLKKLPQSVLPFFRHPGTTIRGYIVLQKIEREKKMLLVQKLTLSEVAYKLNYSSVAHLASQFRKVTGQTSRDFILSSHFKNRIN